MEAEGYGRAELLTSLWEAKSNMKGPGQDISLIACPSSPLPLTLPSTIPLPLNNLFKL
jgi:hypothetical protein